MIHEMLWNYLWLHNISQPAAVRMDRFLFRQGRTFVTSRIQRKTSEKLDNAVKSKTASKKRNKYSNTVILPTTKFPSHLSGQERIKKDEYLTKNRGFSELYEWQRNHLTEPDFILHDGPPYANGVPHMGHAINKILKDITLRSKVLRGKRVHYVPGWDCHGLPVELKVVKNNTVKDPLEIRQKARAYAQEAIAKQREAFQSWGVMADWKEPGCYLTNRPSYMKNELRRFISLYEKGVAFRNFMPVYWSPSSRTALAESELEYNKDHRSKTVIARLRVSDLPEKLNSFKDRPTYALIWTTTPWSLVGNQAVSYCKDAMYCLAEDTTGNLYMIGETLLNDVKSKVGPLQKVASFEGKELENSTYFHPFKKEKLPFLASNHVTMNVGTGLVHTAPAHGLEDFSVALENKIHVPSLIDADGQYTEAAGSTFSGLEALTDGVEKVLNVMGQDVLHVETITHSYPYDWRTKQPVLIRASSQWFIDIHRVRDKVIDILEDIQIYPQCNRTSIINALLAGVKNRPYWCISRQRSWGTPIPVLYSKSTDKPYTNKELVERLCDSIDRYGPDCWWEYPAEKLIGSDVIQALNIDKDDVEKGKDIFDIWFDSGTSWSAVLPNGKADLYLEGHDQYSGWFQSSLITSVALQERVPYSALFVHGFAVDENGLKMSKSIGNVIHPNEVLEGGPKLGKNSVYGIDVLRWWVANHGSHHVQVPASKDLLDECVQCLKKLRLILRFLLGVSHSRYEGANYESQYQTVDKYMLYLLYRYNEQMQQHYNNYEYCKAGQTIMNFIANDVSAFYCSLIKDRLYCDEETSPLRVSAVQVLNATLNVLLRTIAPILPHLAEEAWLHYSGNDESVAPLCCTSYKILESWNNAEIAKDMDAALRLRRNLLQTANTNTWKLEGIIEATEEDFSQLSLLQKERQSSTSELCEILHLSSITLIEKQTFAETQIQVHEIQGKLCERCRRYPEIRDDGLCSRCVGVLEQNKLAAVL